MQMRQIIFNCTDMQITHFILDKILKLTIMSIVLCCTVSVMVSASGRLAIYQNTVRKLIVVDQQ